MRCSMLVIPLVLLLSFGATRDGYARVVGSSQDLGVIPETAYGYTVKHGNHQLANDGSHLVFFMYGAKRPTTTPQGKSLMVPHTGATFMVEWLEKEPDERTAARHAPGVNPDGVFSADRRIRVTVRDVDSNDSVSIDDWLVVAQKVLAALENRAVSRDPLMLALRPELDVDGMRLTNTLVQPPGQGKRRITLIYHSRDFNHEARVEIAWIGATDGKPTKPGQFEVPAQVKEELSEPVEHRRHVAVSSPQVFTLVEAQESWRQQKTRVNTFSSSQRYKAFTDYAERLAERMRQVALGRQDGGGQPLIIHRLDANPPTEGEIIAR